MKSYMPVRPDVAVRLGQTDPRSTAAPREGRKPLLNDNRSTR